MAGAHHAREVRRAGRDKAFGLWLNNIVWCNTMLRFENQEDFVEIGLANQETADLPSRGDAYLTVRVSSAGFSGHNDLWVLGHSLRAFCTALIALEHERRGEAAIEAISPGELTLKIRSVDSRGHMSIEGSTGYDVHRENSRPWHAIHFGFEFDPSQLTKAVSVEWVRKNAGPAAAPDAGSGDVPPTSVS
jgi:hypothetical protein